MRKCQKRPIIWQKRPIPRTKETYRYTDIPEVCVCVCVSVKRGLPYGKRGLFMWQKRPTDILTYPSVDSTYSCMFCFHRQVNTYQRQQTRVNKKSIYIPVTTNSSKKKKGIYIPATTNSSKKKKYIHTSDDKLE